MKTRIVAYTQPVDELHCSIDEFVAYIARVSNPSNQNNHLTAPKLLKYLVKHKHWSPFEHIYVTVEIETTRDIGRQILRHRSFTFQEFSQRYADPTKDMWFEKREARLQDPKNRQNSVDLGTSYDDLSLQMKWSAYQFRVEEEAVSAYKWAIENGIAKEQARAVLPEGMTGSRMYMTGNLRSWIHYCQLRGANGTQKEHQEIAKNIWKQLISYFPCLESITVEDHEVRSPADELLAATTEYLNDR